MTYFDKIDPIGEYMGKDLPISDPMEELEENCANRNTEIHNLKREVQALNELIAGFETYTDNTYMVKNLTNICQRMKGHLKSLDEHNDWVNNFIDKNFDL